MPRLFYILLLGVLLNERAIHSSAIDSKAVGEPTSSVKTIANQTAEIHPPKTRQVEDVIIADGRETLKEVIDDQTTHLFFGEANSFANKGNVRTFPADAFGTLLIPTNQEAKIESSADAPVIILNTNEPVQAGEVDVPVFETQPRQDAENPTGDSQIVASVSESFAESQLDATIDQFARNATTGESIAISKMDEPAPAIQTSGQAAPFDQATNIGTSFVTDSETGEGRQSTASQITHVQETEIAVGDHASPFPSTSGGLDTFQMEQKGDFAVELNPNTNERFNMRSQTATNLNLSGRASHLPLVKVKQVFNIHVKPSASYRPFPRAQWRQEDSSVEFVLNDRVPVQFETGQLARTQESNLGNVDSFVHEDIAGPVQVQPEPIDLGRVIVPYGVPMDPVVHQVSLAEQGPNSGRTDSFIIISSAEQFQKDADVILTIRPKANLGTGVFHTNEGVAQTIPIQPEINLGRADAFVNTEIEGGTQYEPETNIGETITVTNIQTEPRTEMTGIVGYQTESDQPADKQNQISDERALRSAFASNASQSQQSSNTNTQRPINLNRHVNDGDVDEPNISIEIVDRDPRVGAKQATAQRNRTVVVEVDDGIVSSEIIGHIDEHQKIHLPRPVPEQETPSTKAPRRGGNRQKVPQVTIEQIQAAVIDNHADEMLASNSSQSQQSSNNNIQRPINLNRHIIDGDVDEPNISIEIVDRDPRVGAKQATAQRNRTVVVEVDDGIVSSEIIGHIDEHQKIHLPRPVPEQETPSTKAPRHGGNRQKVPQVTIEQIQAAVNDKHADEMRDDSSVERLKQNSRNQSTPSRNSEEQDDHSLEVNVRLLSKIKRIMRPQLRKQERRPKMEFFRHSGEQNDVSSELNDILTNPVFQQKIHEMDGRLKSAPEARSKRLMKKYAEALALSSSSSSPIINSFLPFIIACLLVCW